MRLASRLACTVAALGSFYGCSLINAPDDVESQGSSAGSSATAGSGNSGNGGDQAVGGEPGALGGAGASDPGGGSAGEGGSGPSTPTTGLIVLGAEDAGSERQLVVLNARTGAELSREPLPVAAVAYDEAPGRHVWFVFTASAFPASPTGAADLEVRSFDEATGEWTVLGSTTALPPPIPDQIVVLNDRLTYLSHRVVGGKAVPSLTLLDTSDLTDVTELVTRPSLPAEPFVGLVGERGSDVNPNAAGGRLRVMTASDCGAAVDADCQLNAQQMFVANGFTEGTSANIDRFVGQPRFARARLEDRLYAVLRSTTPSNRLVVRSFAGANLGSPTVFTVSSVSGNDVGGFDLLECANAGVFTDVAGSQLVAFHLSSGQQRVQALPHAGAPVYSDTFSSSVIALNPEAAPGASSFEVSKSGATSIVVNARSAFQPPDDLIAYTAATRRGESAECQ